MELVNNIPKKFAIIYYDLLSSRLNECAKIRSLLLVCQLLQEVIKNETVFLASLKPRFYLIGSVAEGTRLFNGNEIDVTVQFDALHNSPLELLDGSACEFVIGVNHPLRKFAKMRDGKEVLHYEHFFISFLGDLQKILLRMQAAKLSKWPQDLFFQEKVKHWNSCDDCLAESLSLAQDSIYSPQRHCKKCLPLVSHTKIGPCLIFQWGPHGIPVTMDLIPVFPLKSPEGVLPLFNSVIQTLLERKPENWVRHLKGMVQRDRILPESYLKFLDSDANTGTCDVAMKLLNYDKETNFIIRPGQVMHVNQFDRNVKLKDIYVHAKVMKTVLKLDVKSYLMKKVILLDTMVEKLLKPEVWLDEAIFMVLSHPELKTEFAKRVQFNKWSDAIQERKKTGSREIVPEIPLSDKK